MEDTLLLSFRKIHFVKYFVVNRASVRLTLERRWLKYKISTRDIDDERTEKLYNTMEYASFYSCVLQKIIH